MTRARKAAILSFVAVWNAMFLYETFRAFQLAPLARRLGYAGELPKLPLLFPPAGWIMFYRVDNDAGGMEVYGVRKGERSLIDPHRIFATRFVLFDNIRRGMMYSAAEPGRQWDFCNYLRRKFPEFEDFAVTQYEYPSPAGQPEPKRVQADLYSCRPF
jgi:hypothetical protein